MSKAAPTHIEKDDANKSVESKYKAISIFANILYWIGAIASATQGYFSINAFVTSLSVVPGLSFLSLIPYFYIFLSATTIALYSIIVEQQIFYKHFLNLIKQFFAKLFPSAFTDLKHDKTYHEQTKELKAKLDALAEPSEVKKQPEKPPTKSRLFFSWLFYKIRFYTGHLIAFVIVTLRAIVSIGSTMLGLKSIFLVIAAAFFIPVLPSYLIPVYALMSAISYIIKSSQNLVCQFNETLNLLGFKRFVKKDFETSKREYKSSLKDIFKNNVVTKKTKNTNLSWSQYFLSKLSKGDMSWWEYGARRLFDILFIVGAIGASMTGFFSIDKFFSQMGSVSFLSFFSMVPGGVIIGAACTIAVYTLFVEQKILYNYFGKLVDAFFPRKITADKPAKKLLTLDEKIYSKRNKILAIYQHPLMKGNKGLECKITHLKDLSIELSQPSYSSFRLFLSKTGTVVILLLRAITSIGPSTLGLTVAVQLIAKFAFSATLGPWVFALCAVMALGGYIIKCSQNLSDHYYNTLSDMFGVTLNGDKKQKELLRNLDKEYLNALEQFNEVKSSQPTPENTQSQSSDDEMSKALLEPLPVSRSATPIYNAKTDTANGGVLPHADVISASTSTSFEATTPANSPC